MHKDIVNIVRKIVTVIKKEKCDCEYRELFRWGEKANVIYYYYNFFTINSRMYQEGQWDEVSIYNIMRGEEVGTIPKNY